MSSWRHAFSLTKAEVAECEPPGTVRLVEHELHRTTTGTAHEEDSIQLIPQPTRSAADPLNWSATRRWAILFTMAFYALSADFASGVVAPALTIMQFQFSPPQSIDKLTQLVAVNTLLLGTSNIIWVPLGNIFGRRPILITGLTCLLLTSIWCGLATSIQSLLAARALQGFSAGPVYTFAPEIAGDVFFLHERGRAMAIYTMCLAGGPFLGGVVGGYIAGNLGYKWIFWISAILVGFTLVLEALIVPETLFDRERQMRLEREGFEGEVKDIDGKQATSKIEKSSQALPATKESWTYLQSLKFGTYTGNVGQKFAAPWLSLAFPGTWVVMLQYGGLVGGIVTLSTVGPIFLAQPPYLWGKDVGLINLGGVIGVAVGAALTFFTADYLATRTAKKERHGFYEPEARLPGLFPGLFIATTGLWTFGFCAANPSPRGWVGLAVGTGMLSGATTMVPSIGFNYIIDAYNPIRGDCFVMTTILRSVISFAWTFFVSSWVAKDGAALPFGIFGMLMGIFGLTALPLWIYGKRSRIATAGLLPKVAS